MNNFQKKVLRKIYENKRNFHALLFCGPTGTGKFQAAIDFICLDQEMKKRRKQIEKGIFPEVIVLEPEKVEKQNKIRLKNISIAQTRVALKKLALSSCRVERKFLVIKNAEQLNMGAANSLLKALEEPPYQTAIILIATSEEKILPTIRSRCQKIFFHPLSEEKVEAYLTKKFPHETEEKKKAAARLAQGRYKLAEKLLEDEAMWQQKKTAREQFRRALKGGVGAGLKLVEENGQSEEILMNLAEEGLVYLIDFLKECLRTGKDWQVIKKIFQLAEMLFEKKALLEETNASKKLQLEDFFIQIN